MELLFHLFLKLIAMTDVLQKRWIYFKAVIF